MPDELKKYKKFLNNWYKVRKSSSKCLLCNKTKKLQYHHINPATKVETIAHMVFQCYDLEAIKLELDKCVCLCEKCHIAVHQGKVSISITKKKRYHRSKKHSKGHKRRGF